MRWEQPLWLLLAPLALALFVYDRRGGESRRAALPYSGTEDLLALPAGSGRLVRLLPALLQASALLLCIAAMARPQKVLRQDAGLARGVDIMLALDTSTSMLALDFDPLDRMGAAKKAAREFIDRRVSDRIGIVVFGGAPLLACPLTLDYDALRGYLDEVSAGMTGTQGTAVGDGLAAAVDRLKESGAKSRVVVLLTDGNNNAGLLDPVTAAATAKAYGVRVYAIGAGKRGPAMVPVPGPFGGTVLAQIPDELDEGVLLRVAAEADGKYFRATNAKELSGIYAEIDRLEKSDAKAPEILSAKDLYPFLLVPAALLLALELLLTRTRWMRIP